ncbi:hypothetical protein BX600DRAFT_205209 [Xylariales sp. PMI_506]|nr:hypothetical protein BX600DRAFT_205209 [Xylariales sp. PMI_506]
MRFFQAVVPLTVAFLASFGAAASDTTDVTIPDCGLLCIVNTVPSTPCQTIANITCICTNEEAIALIGECVAAQCSIRDALTTEKYDTVTCGYSTPDNSKEVSITTPVFGVLAILAFILRVVSRWVTGFKATWGLDDWVMVPAVVASIPTTALSILLANHGLGRDLWMVDQDDITYILYIYYWDEILYNFVIPCTKVSILCFYLRIFPAKGFRMWVYSLIAANVAYFIAFDLATIFQCTPIDGAWLDWDGEWDGVCRDVNLQAWVAAAVSIALDIATIILPMPELWKLNLSIKKKLQVMSMFAVGAFVTVVSILRLQYLLDFASDSNVTQNFVPVGVWSTVETCVGIVCACMPAIRSLCATALPSAFGTSKGSEYVNGKNTANSSFSAKSKHIRVKSEFVLSSRTKAMDESSIMELTPFESEEDRANRKGGRVDSDDERHTYRKETTARESV